MGKTSRDANREAGEGLVKVLVELFGVPRQRVGAAAVELCFPHASVTLSEVLIELGRRYPEFASDCLNEHRLKPQYIANLGGRRFICDPQISLSDGDSLLVMSADAGG